MKNSNSKAIFAGILLLGIFLLLGQYFSYQRNMPYPELVLRDHKDFVTSIAFSPNGKYLATADQSGMVNLWDASRMTLSCQIKTNKGITAILFLPDSRTLVCGDMHGNLTFWDTAKRSLEKKYNIAPIYGITSAPDGILAIATLKKFPDRPGQQNQIIFMNYNKMKFIRTWQNEGGSFRLFSIALSPDGKKIAYITQDDTLILKDVSTGKIIWRLHQPMFGSSGPGEGISFSPDGKDIATTYSNMDSSAEILEASSGKAIIEIGRDKPLGAGVSVVYMPQGDRLLVLTAWNNILVVNKKGKILEVYSLQGNGSSENICVSPSSEIFAVSHGNTVEVWNIKPKEVK